MNFFELQLKWSSGRMKCPLLKERRNFLFFFSWQPNTVVPSLFIEGHSSPFELHLSSNSKKLIHELGRKDQFNLLWLGSLDIREVWFLLANEIHIFTTGDPESGYCGGVDPDSMHLFRDADSDLPWTGIIFGLSISSIWYWWVEWFKITPSDWFQNLTLCDKCHLV